MKCPYCGASRFRLSHLRISDFVRLLALRYPVSCRLCRERVHIAFSAALRLRSESRAHREAAIEQHQSRLRQEAAEKQAAIDNPAIRNNVSQVEKKVLHR